MKEGEQLIVHTPGAGGWGAPEGTLAPRVEVPVIEAARPKAGLAPPPYTKANGSVSQYSQTQAECD